MHTFCSVIKVSSIPFVPANSATRSQQRPEVTLHKQPYLHNDTVHTIYIYTPSATIQAHTLIQNTYPLYTHGRTYTCISPL